MSVVRRRNVVTSGDWRFDNLSGRQRQVNLLGSDDMPSAEVVETSVTTVTTVSGGVGRGMGGGGEKRGVYWSTWIPELPCVGTNIITLSQWLCQFPCLGSSSSPSKQICTVDDNVTFKISVLVILILDIRSRLTLLLLRWNSSALDLKETFSGIKCLRIFCV